MRNSRLFALMAVACLSFVAACSSSTTTVATRPSDHGNIEATAPASVGAPHCGIERWAVKTGTDALASQVNLNDPQQSTVQALGTMPVPTGWSEDAGRQPAEMTAYTIHATLIKYKQEADSDYHLVVQDEQGNTMIVEIPFPPCVHGSSPFADGIAKARQQFDLKFPNAGNGSWHQANIPVIVTGVLFFDSIHGQTGVAPNGAELHPLTDVQFATSPTATAATTAFAKALSTIPPKIKPCFDNHGVQFGSFSAWLCEHKLGGDPSGGLYFSLSVDDGLNHANPNGQMMWSKLHAAPGNYYAWENYSEPWGGESPRANSRIIMLDEGPNCQFMISWPDWTVTPTEGRQICDGGATVGPLRPMTQREQNSVAEYAANARSAIPLSYR